MPFFSFDCLVASWFKPNLDLYVYGALRVMYFILIYLYNCSIFENLCCLIYCVKMVVNSTTDPFHKYSGKTDWTRKIYTHIYPYRLLSMYAWVQLCVSVCFCNNVSYLTRWKIPFLVNDNNPLIWYSIIN